jgi:hypothetical protein
MTMYHSLGSLTPKQNETSNYQNTDCQYLLKVT